MSNTKNLPTPPGGSITCEVNQLGTVKPRGDGTYDYCCHTIPPAPPGGGTQAQQQLGGGLGKGLVHQGVKITPDLPIKKYNGIDCVQINNQLITLHDLDMGMRILLEDNRPFGGVSIKTAIKTAENGSIEIDDGIIFYVSFPLAKNKLSGPDQRRRRPPPLMHKRR